MKVKQLIEELQKLNPEIECVAKSFVGGYNSIVEVKTINVMPFHVGGTSYYKFDFVHELTGFPVYEIISKSLTK